MNTLVQINDSAASNKKMDTSRQMTQNTVNDRRRPDQFPSYPREFGQRRPFQHGTPTPTIAAPLDNENQTATRTTKKKVVHYFLSKSNESTLKTCANAWVPKCLRGKDANDSSADKDSQIEEIRSKLLSILNKISPENMAQLSDSIVSLPIETDEHLKNVIDLLFQKAIDEPNFTPQYAYVCKVLHDNEVKSKSKRQTMTFKKLLTKCCQDRFETMQVHERTLAKSLKDLGDCDDKEMKEQMKSKYDHDESVHRKRSVGNCRFMCELYKVLILTNRTLETCMKHLLKSPNEETLECACNILKHAGKSLNSKAIFDQLNEYASSAYRTRIPTRIRFMILDTVELRDNDWVPRHSRTKPEIRNTSVQPNAAKTQSKQCTRLQNTPAVLPTKSAGKPSEQMKSKRPTEIKKENEHKNNVLAKGMKTADCSSSPMSLSDVVKGKNSSVLPCVIPVETNQTNSGGETLNNDENTEAQDIEKECRSILDNITRANMVSTAKNIVSMPIKTDVCLKNIVELLFQKAVDEPSQTPLYAHVCLIMNNMEIHLTDQETTSTSFRKLLIKKCQDTFESISARKHLVAKLRKDIEFCKDKEMKKQRQNEFDKNETVHRGRSLANCRFMCELMKVNIIVPPVLEMCLAELVQCPKELALECACVILQHAGSAIDHSGIFEKLLEHSTAQKPKFCPRIRTMILDTLKLEDQDWTERDEQQIFDETKQETFSESPLTSTTTPPSTDLQPVLTAQNSTHPEFNDHKTVKSIIDSVTADTMNTAINELSVHIKNVDVMERTIDFLFAKSHPKAIPELVGVCSSLRNTTTSPAAEEHTKPTSLRKLITIRCNKILLAGVQNNPSEDESRPKESYAFIGELFNENVASAHILVEFLKVLPEKLSNGALENACCLLKVAGKRIEQAYSLKKTVRKLTEMVSNDVQGIFSRRSGVLLKTLVELRDNKWVS